MKILIAVASKHGSTREIAEVIGEELRAKHLIYLQDAEEVQEIANYDAVILGSAVYAGNWLPAAQKFGERFQKDLLQLPVWVFSSGPLGAKNPQPQEDPAKLAAPLGDVKVREHRVFLGKLASADLSFNEKVIARMVRAPEGDFRDWDEIRRWAREISRQIRAESAFS